jgi:endonuclease-8
VPEGDTIYRAARTLHAALAGKRVVKFETVFSQLARQAVEGRTVERVSPIGKHLLMEFSGDLALRTHMRMNGSWHIYRPGERWRMRFSDMRIVLEVEDFVAVAFNVPVAEFLDGRALERQDDLANIGPDFLGEAFDDAEAMRRIRERPDEEIADVILNQRVVAGIGNEYKSEVLFVCGISPFAKVGTLSDERLGRLLEVSRKLMLWNVRKREAGRFTRNSLDPRQRVWVYGRGGKPCRKCGAPVRYAKQGPHARGTYWCANCQG